MASRALFMSSVHPMDTAAMAGMSPDDGAGGVDELARQAPRA
jgi:hypothetical protein